MQLAAVMAVLVTVPLMTLGYSLIRTSQAAVKTSVLRDHEQLAIRAASEVGEFVKRPRNLLEVTASILGAIDADVWKQETVLVELALHEDIFGRISSVSLEGRELAASEIGTPLKDRSSEPLFQKAAGGVFAMSDIYFSKDDLPYAVMGVPVRRMGETAGVLMADVNLRGFWNIVDNIRIGRTGRAGVVSDKGILIAHEDKKKVLEREDLSDRPGVQAVLQGKAGAEESPDREGKNWLMAYVPIPDLGWGLAIRQSAEEAYAFSYWMKVLSWVLIFMSVGMAMAISFLLARLLVKPIQLLIEKTKRVAEGDFDQTLPVERGDEIGNLLRAFNDMTAKLKEARQAEKMAAIGKAAAAITHELKNSVTMAAALISLLPKRRDDGEFMERFAKVVPQELENWKDLLQSISDFSRQAKFPLSPVEVGPFLEDFRLLVEERLVQRKVQLEWKAEGRLPVIEGNPAKLRQVLLNLVLNAAEAMPEGGMVKVAAGCVQADGGRSLEIRIEDTGKGIPPDHLAAIFEPFYTTKHNGLGLGLAICRGIVDQHGGRIRVDSKVGRGTTFVLQFPVAHPSP